MLMVNILLDAFAALGCLVSVAAVGVGLLVWAALSSDVAKAVARKLLQSRGDDPPPVRLQESLPRPVPDDLKVKERR